jgi:single-strand DNA-binding protein
MSTSRSLNKVILIGNLTRNPVLRSTANSSTVCTFGIATNSSWKDGSGSLQERTEFHNVVAWNKLAEICAQLLAVGMSVYIEGELRTRTWTDTNGVRHYRTEIKAQDMKLLDNKDKKGVGVDAAKTAAEDSKEEFGVNEEETQPVEQVDNNSADSDTQSGEDLF